MSFHRAGDAGAAGILRAIGQRSIPESEVTAWIP